VYDVKHDGRHKSRFVAGGHLTEVPVESVYSGVVSLRSLRLCVFLAELNKLELWGADIGNAYLEAETKEKVFFIAGPEFEDRQGHILIIHKALYGLRSSGLRWGEKFSDSLRDLGFEPSKADPMVWMRANEEHDVYEYIAVYVDDLCIAAKNPQEIIDWLLDPKHGNFKLKGVGPLKYHLGCNFERDPDGTLCFGPIKYIGKMMDSYQQLFGESPKEAQSPLEKNDHPELDESELLTLDGIRQYQSLIGAAQWLISLGRFDIATAVMTMSRFRAAPRQGHMDRLKRIFGYVKRFKSGCIRVRTEEPDYSNLPDMEFDWAYTVYGRVTEQVPKDAPKPRGKSVVITSYWDANLYHDMITGRAVTGVLELLNKTPIDWYTRRQATVETATYGSEFVAGRTAVDRAIDLRLTLRYLGVPVKGKTIMFTDNQSVFINASLPHSPLKKRHQALSYHRVREAIAAKIINLFKIHGPKNPADILSKHWGHADVWNTLRPILFWRGDTAKCPRDDLGEADKHTKGECQKSNLPGDPRFTMGPAGISSVPTKKFKTD
jgi:hypothetical protein